MNPAGSWESIKDGKELLVGVVESNSSFLSALQIINVLLNSMIAQLMSELIVSQHLLRSC